ncbi:hypothetical protein KBC99_00910 [Candidatus Saccharibacteria bacterium]|nr:hypothetical protein [Candidatus Saccharibacteria bacterium]
MAISKNQIRPKNSPLIKAGYIISTIVSLGGIFVVAIANLYAFFLTDVCSNTPAAAGFYCNFWDGPHLIINAMLFLLSLLPVFILMKRVQKPGYKMLIILLLPVAHLLLLIAEINLTHP